MAWHSLQGKNEKSLDTFPAFKYHTLDPSQATSMRIKGPSRGRLNTRCKLLHTGVDIVLSNLVKLAEASKGV